MKLAPWPCSCTASALISTAATQVFQVEGSESTIPFLLVGCPAWWRSPQLHPLPVNSDARCGPLPRSPAQRRGAASRSVKPCGRRQAKLLPHHGVLGVAAVLLVAGEPGICAQVLPAGGAEAADATGRVEPGHSHPVPRTEPHCSRAGQVHYPTIWWPGIKGSFGAGSLPSMT